MSLALKSKWTPSATIETLKKRAEILKKIRAFFARKDILEVDTSLLCTSPVTDPFLEALSLSYQNKSWYLQTSPEYAMKRLLCAGSGSIYQICKAFRADESGRMHNPEFTMLEWYHIGFDHHDLMAEMDIFLQYVINTKPAVKITYQNIFEHYLQFDPHNVSEQELKKIMDSRLRGNDNGVGLDRDDYLNLLFTHIIEPQLDKERPLFIYDYPTSQAALAKINNGIGERFEVYIKGIELANGYHELGDAKEQKKRFEQDLTKRKKLHLPDVPIDENLLCALDNTLPDCAGVALGIDRLIMIALGKETIADVIAFDSARS